MDGGYDEQIRRFPRCREGGAESDHWRRRNHPDYTEALVRLSAEGIRRPRGYVVLASHIYLEPRKYTFSLIFGSEKSWRSTSTLTDFIAIFYE